MTWMDEYFFNSMQNSNTPIQLAAKHGHLPVVRLLIDAKAKLDAVDNGKCELFAVQRFH